MRVYLTIPLLLIDVAALPASASNTQTQTVTLVHKPTRISNMAHDLFTFSTPDVVAAWSATDDRVMGGVSRSQLRFDPVGHAFFEGVMSMEKNGGFASVRAWSEAPSIPNATHYVIELRGDGKRYKLNLRMSGRVDAVSYQATFATVAGRWTKVAVPVNSFVGTFRGRRVIDAPMLDATEVNQVGLMIADGQDGPFQLAVRRISVEAR
jgi:NADH dehydrogenase [ubiquinone] 1 alpha subcomplex assembly factor 1